MEDKQPLEIIELSPFEIRANDLRAKADELEVTSADGITKANALFKQCQETLREIKDKKKDLLAPFEQALEKITGLADMVAMPIKEAKTVIEEKALAYKAELERLRVQAAEIERKRLEEVRLVQEAERKRVEAEEKVKREAEEARLLAIRQEQEDERAKLAVEADALKRKEMEIKQKQIDEAAALERERVAVERQKRENDAERERLEAEKKAEAVRQEAEKLRVAAEKEAEATKVRGLTSYWKYEVVDVALLDPFYMMPDPTKINAAIKDGARAIEGLRIYEDKKMK